MLYLGPVWMKGEMRKNIVEFAKNWLILSQFYSTLFSLPPPSIQTDHYLPLNQSEGKFFGQGKKLRQQIIFFNKNKNKNKKEQQIYKITSSACSGRLKSIRVDEFNYQEKEEFNYPLNVVKVSNY